MMAGLTRELYDIKWLAEMVEAHRPEPKKARAGEGDEVPTAPAGLVGLGR